MKKILTFIISAALLLVVLSVNVFAAAKTHTVVKGDSMWKIAVKYQVGLSELKSENPHIENPALIYPGQVITIPTLDSGVSAYEAEVVRLVNIERSKNGLSPLKEDWELSRVARYKSQDMKDKNYFSHTSPTYGSPFDMMQRFGVQYSSAGENIAAGQQTAEEVMNSWMHSSGHRANILNADYEKIGIGFVKGGQYGTYWVQLFKK